MKNKNLVHIEEIKFEELECLEDTNIPAVGSVCGLGCGGGVCGFWC